MSDSAIELIIANKPRSDIKELAPRNNFSILFATIFGTKANDVIKPNLADPFSTFLLVCLTEIVPTILINAIGNKYARNIFTRLNSKNEEIRYIQNKKITFSANSIEFVNTYLPLPFNMDSQCFSINNGYKEKQNRKKFIPKLNGIRPS